MIFLHRPRYLTVAKIMVRRALWASLPNVRRRKTWLLYTDRRESQGSPTLTEGARSQSCDSLTIVINQSMCFGLGFFDRCVG